MPIDDHTYGFSKDDAEALVQSIGNTDREFPEIEPRSRGGSSHLFQGNLTAIADGTGDYTGKKVGTVTVVVAPCGSGNLIGDSVSVVDWSGCVFDLPIGDLNGVWVWFGKGVAESLAPEATEGQLTPCHYVAHDRCCVSADGA